MPSDMQTNKDDVIKGKDHIGNATDKKRKIKKAQGNPNEKPHQQKENSRTAGD